MESNLLQKSGGKKRKQWAIIPHVIAEVTTLPKMDTEILEVITFDKKNIPQEFAWWNKRELAEFLEEFDHAI